MSVVSHETAISDDYYLISRGDFSGDVISEQIEEWDEVALPASGPSSQPLLVAQGAAFSAFSSSASTAPGRRMSLNQLVAKIQDGAPRSVDKRLPKQDPRAREQTEAISEFLLDRDRRHRAEEERTRAWAKAGCPLPPGLKLYDGTAEDKEKLAKWLGRGTAGMESQLRRGQAGDEGSADGPAFAFGQSEQGGLLDLGKAPAYERTIEHRGQNTLGGSEGVAGGALLEDATPSSVEG